MQRLVVLRQLQSVLAMAIAERCLEADRRWFAQLPDVSRRERRFGNAVARSVNIGRGLVMHLKSRRPGAKLTPTARPREQRPRRRLKTATRGDPDEPPLDEIPPAEFRRQLDAALGGRV
jgi:hypothetical protein